MSFEQQGGRNWLSPEMREKIIHPTFAIVILIALSYCAYRWDQSQDPLFSGEQETACLDAEGLIEEGACTLDPESPLALELSELKNLEEGGLVDLGDGVVATPIRFGEDGIEFPFQYVENGVSEEATATINFSQIWQLLGSYRTREITASMGEFDIFETFMQRLIEESEVVIYRVGADYYLTIDHPNGTEGVNTILQELFLEREMQNLHAKYDLWIQGYEFVNNPNEDGESRLTSAIQQKFETYDWQSPADLLESKALTASLEQLQESGNESKRLETELESQVKDLIIRAFTYSEQDLELGPEFSNTFEVWLTREGVLVIKVTDLEGFLNAINETFPHTYNSLDKMTLGDGLDESDSVAIAEYVRVYGAKEGEEGNNRLKILGGQVVIELPLGYRIETEIVPLGEPLARPPDSFPAYLEIVDGRRGVPERTDIELRFQ